MSLTHAQPRWQRRAGARPQELLQAALEAFVERGYAATRLEQVARQAGVSKATLYLYYENKAELFKAVVREAVLPNFAQAEALVKTYAGPRRELLALTLCGLWRRMACSRLSGIPKLVIAEAGNFPEIARFYHHEVIQRGRRLILGIVEQGVARGEFRPVDPQHVWRVIIAPLLLGMLWKHSFLSFEGDTFDDERHLQSHLDLLFNGLALKRADVALASACAKEL